MLAILRWCLITLVMLLMVAAGAAQHSGMKSRSSKTTTSKERQAAEAEINRLTAEIERHTQLLHEAVLAMKYNMPATAELIGARMQTGTVTTALNVHDSNIFFAPELSTAWAIGEKQIGVVLGSASPALVRVLWDRAVFVDPSNASHRVIHAGIRLMDRDSLQPPSSIAPGTRIDESLYPSDYFHFDKEWQRAKLFEASDISKSISLVLPIEVAGETHDYTFTFAIRAADPAALLEREQKDLLSIIKTDSTLEEVVKAFGREPDVKTERATTFGNLLHIEYHLEGLAFELLDGKVESIVNVAR